MMTKIQFPDDPIRGYAEIPEISTRMYRDAAQVTVAATEISAHVSRQIVDSVAKDIARRMGMHEEEMKLFLRFLATDEELQSRFLAWRTAARLRGDVA